MPSTRRWSVPHRRIVVIAILAVIGSFLVSGGLGMGKWLVGALGIAIVAVGAGIFLLSALNSRATSEIEGTGHVVSASAPPSGVTHGRCRLNLVVYGKGINGVAVKIRDVAVPVAKWPDAGADLPVMIAIGKPQRTRVIWAEVATHAEFAEEAARTREADERAAAMADGDEYADGDWDLDEFGSGRSPADTSSSDFTDSVAERIVDPLVAPIIESVADDPNRPDVPAASDEPAMAGSGARTIEMDVMDPSLMRWSAPPSQRRPAGSRPSPNRRRRTRSAADPAADFAAVSADPTVLDKPISAGSVPTRAMLDELDIAGSVSAAAPEPPRPDDGERTQSGRTATATRPAPPEWPPRSPAAAEAAARLPHQWDDDDGEDHDHDGDGDDGGEGDDAHDQSAAEHGTTPSPDQAAEPRFRRVPRNRSASEEELFDQEAPYDDGPAYSPDTAYAEDAGYNSDAAYSPDAEYGESGHPNDPS